MMLPYPSLLSIDVCSHVVLMHMLVYMGSRIETLNNLALMIVWENPCAISRNQPQKLSQSTDWTFQTRIGFHSQSPYVTSFWNLRAFQEGCSTCQLENKLLTKFILVLMKSKPFSSRRIPRKQSIDDTFRVVYEVFISIMIFFFEAIFFIIFPVFLEFYLLFSHLCDV